MNKLPIIIAVTGILIGMLSCRNEPVRENLNENSRYTRRTVNLGALGTELITNLDQKLFNAVMEGKIKAYKVDSLSSRSVYSLNELKDFLSHKETVTINNPDNPYVSKDTTVVTPFKVSDIVGHSIGEKWIINDEKTEFQGKLYAFAINWKPVIANIEIHEQAAFWIAYSDLNKILTPGEMKSLNKAIYDGLMKRLSDYD